jgi:phage terminase large subunit
VTLQADLFEQVERRIARLESASGRFAKYHDDPVGFFREVLGRKPWRRQVEILLALARGDRVSCVSGHGIGKTHLAAGAVWWFVSTRGPGCRAFLTSSKGDQTEQGVWREIRSLYLQAKVPLGGVLPKLGKTGWNGPEEQQILILTADTAEAFQGLRAPEMMLVADEASGIEERIFVAMDANLSGGGKFLLIGNPAESAGYFFRSQQIGSDFERFHVSSLESPNVVAGRIVVKGLTTLEWCRAREKDWGGKDSALYRMRVLGEFLIDETGKPITWKTILAAQKRFGTTKPMGRLCVGLDPAGPGRYGDDSAIAWRRGNAMMGLLTSPTWTEDEIVKHTLDVIRVHRTDETPRLVIDSGGPIGSALLGRFAAIARGARPGHDFEVFGVRADWKAQREPTLFCFVRDELFEHLSRWLKAGGAISDDSKLAGELNAPRWLVHNDGRLKLQRKDDVRKDIGRSPDRADALALAVWEPIAWQPDVEPDAPGLPPADPQEAAEAFDMQAGTDPWWPT